MPINLETFEKKVDEERGAILFYKKGFQGLPDKVVHGKGFTIEIKNKDVVLLDIYKPEFVLSRLLKESLTTGEA